MGDKRLPTSFHTRPTPSRLSLQQEPFHSIAHLHALVPAAPLPRVRSIQLLSGRVEQGLFLPLIQLLWCFGFVNMYGCWGCVGGAAGNLATTSLTYRISQFDANWVALGVALWSLVLIVASEAAFMWQEQVALRSAATLLPALLTLWFLYKSVSAGLFSGCAPPLYGSALLLYVFNGFCMDICISRFNAST